MMTAFRKAAARTVIVIGTCSGALHVAHAETRSFQFAFDWDQGPLAGQTTTGYFSFDASLFHPTRYVQADQLLSELSAEIDGRTFEESQAPGHYLRFYPDGRLRMMAVGNNCGPVTCYVDNPHDWTIAWDGGDIGYALYAHAPNGFSYAELINMQEVSVMPEPDILALLGVPVIGWCVRRRGTGRQWPKQFGRLV